MKKPQLKNLVGSKIVAIRLMTKGELADYGLSDSAVIIDFHNGLQLVACADSQFSGPGCFAIEYDNQTFFLVPGNSKVVVQ